GGRMRPPSPEKRAAGARPPFLVARNEFRRPASIVRNGRRAEVDEIRVAFESIRGVRPSMEERVARARSDGARAELAVVRYLVERGVTIVAQNLRIGMLELDIVARDGPVVVVVEVRTRGSNAWTRAFGSFDSAKRRRVRH